MADKRIIEQTATSEVFVDDWLVKDSSTEGTTKIRPSNLKDYIAAGLVPETMVADEYVTTSTYYSGDICIYEGVLYKALEDDITGDWDSTKWDAITISSELENSGTGNVADVYVNGVSVLDADTIAQIKSYKEVTQAEYDALPSSKLTDGIMYCIKDSEFSAENVPYDNTTSHAQATNTQSAIDEAFSRTVDLAGAISSISASPYSPQHSYHVCDYAMYDFKLYRCISDTSGAWDSTKWEEVKIADEIKEVNSTIDNLLIQKSIENTDIATFSDGSNLPMPSLKVGIEPIQEGSGDPSPSNVRPISGWSAVDVTKSGKNLFGGAYNEYFPIHFNEDKVVIASADVPSESTNPVQIAYYDKNKTLIDYWGLSTQYSAINNRVARSFTLPKESYYLRYITQSSANYQIEFGETNSVYEPYNGSTITIQLGDTYYGGTLDVVSGVLTVDRECVTYDGSENWVLYGSGSASAFAMVVDSTQYNLNVDTTPITNSLKGVPRNATWGDYADFVSYNSVRQIVCGINTITTPEAWKTYLASNNLQVMYELATPIVVQLTPTQVKSLLGSNTVWCDTGKILKLEYLANATDVIASLDARITALENA